jgi:AcrR family transcriptional regulator
MSMDSYLPKRRTPQQERGERRVAELLEAAAKEFAEVGYDLATMKAIAQRAGASVGAIYQYFPDKKAVVSALRARYVHEMEQRWMELERVNAGSSVREGAQRFVDEMIRFMDAHPAYNAILDAATDSRRDKKIREQLRGRLGAAFRARRSWLSEEQAHRIASVVLQMIKGMNVLYADAKPQERAEIAKEYKLALSSYLENRFHS